MDYREVIGFYKDKRVFITGHTGFKGSWLSHLLLSSGARVTGYALENKDENSLFKIAGIDKREGMHSIYGDVRDREELMRAVAAARPDIVIHMAAQPLVIDSYKRPAYTYETNVMGTVNIMEAVRACESAGSFLNVTTDKVYLNDESGRGFKEDMPLDGYDPYSNSKSCSELVTASYRRSFLEQEGVSVSTARAGNVIGGGDFAENRIVPDCVRAAIGKTDINIRNPYSVRPYQHVLEPLFAYLMIAKAQLEDPALCGSYNVGPDETDCVTTGEVADIFCRKWGEGLKWINASTEGPHEASFLKLDCTKLKETFGWQPKWNIETAIERTVEWSKAWRDGRDITLVMDSQAADFTN